MKIISYLILLCFCLYSCEKEQTDIETMILGKTFSNQSLSLTFENNDSVSFQTKNTLYILKGKSKYEINNGRIIIKSPYGKRLEPDETTDSYILSFIGSLKKNRIDDATYSIIGAYEKEQFFGDEVTLFLE
ncbi:hypothetical protein [Bacteroides fragilis]|jgi:outer membrane lipoprotein-sorting protein|uniref:hypothetical protein n=1 Tax=Bacteroides fragilis TaxID=817 RepID=UPI0005B4329F|nr:hypothetical protein [Bacteroides fragilis]MCZ2583092.1 hypothetical protein [Bacteroides fragilis]